MTIKKKEILDPLECWSEHQHQVQIIKNCDFVVRHKLHGHEALKWLHAVPNGGQRHPAVAAKLKAEGVKKGVCDLMLDWQMGCYAGLRIELKKLKGSRPTAEQNDYLAHVASQGFIAHVCYGYKDAWTTICQFLEIKDPLCDHSLREKFGE
jgi:hypothetical protein